MAEEKKTKHTIKDSVFTNLFGIPEYQLKMYQFLHPEDTDTTEEDLTTITLENIFADDIYNDVGVQVKDLLIMLVECQSTWSVNIIIRMLEYLVNTYRRYFTENNSNLYANTKVKLPKPELYVVYTGDRKTKPNTIKLSEEFFNGMSGDLEVTVHVIYGDGENDIISQYVKFTKVLDEQVKSHGKTRKAVQEAIKICKDKDILKKYLQSKESEVVDIMMQLYDQEEVMRVYGIGLQIKTIAENYKELGATFADAVKKVVDKFNMSQSNAENAVREYW